jgi:Uma2 family endonuclease
MQVLATYRFTTDEYHRLGEAGILGEDDRVELLNGDLVVREPVGGEHRTLVDSLTILFANRIGQNRYRIGIQNPISLDLTASLSQTLYYMPHRFEGGIRDQTRFFF